MKNKTGLGNTDVETVWSVYDTLFCEVKLENKHKDLLNVAVPTVDLMCLFNCS